MPGECSQCVAQHRRWEEPVWEPWQLQSTGDPGTHFFPCHHTAQTTDTPPGLPLLPPIHCVLYWSHNACHYTHTAHYITRRAQADFMMLIDCWESPQLFPRVLNRPDYSLNPPSGAYTQLPLFSQHFWLHSPHIIHQKSPPGGHTLYNDWFLPIGIPDL